MKLLSVVLELYTNGQRNRQDVAKANRHALATKHYKHARFVIHVVKGTVVTEGG
jgi:hypothetical protein